MDVDRVRDALAVPGAAPIHARLRQAIHAQITDGTIKPGMCLPSERLLQEELSLSRSTVRQAIGALIQSGLLQSVAGTGTFVMERPGTPPSLGLIGLIVSGPNFHFFYPQLAASLNHGLRQSGYGLAMMLHNDRAEELEELVDEILAQGIVALALTPPRFGDVDPVVDQLRRKKIPFIFIGRRGTNSRVDWVATDNEKVGYDATRHLVDLGHRRIVHAGLLDYSTGKDRAAGYERAMSEAGLESRVVELREQRAPESSADGVPQEHLATPAYEEALHLWGEGASEPPTAAFCFNDVTAMGVYKACRDLSLRIPEQVSLIAVDNLPTIRHFEVPITTMALPGEEIGRLGADLLLRRLAGDEMPPQHHLLPARLIKRLSTAAPRSGQG